MLKLARTLKELGALRRAWAWPAAASISIRARTRAIVVSHA